MPGVVVDIDILSQVLNVTDLQAGHTSRTAPGSTQPISFGDEHCRAHILLRGTARYQPAAAVTSQQLVAGDILLATRPTVHVIAALARGNSQRIDTVWITIEFLLDRKSPHPLWAQLPDELLLRGEEVTDHAELLRTVDLLEAELLNHQPGEKFIAQRLSEVTVVAALRRYQRLEAAGEGFMAALADLPTRRALAAIHSDPARRWDLDELATAAGLSVGTFGERFHRLVGETPMRYLRLWRLLSARRLISATPTPINRVAAQAGYQSAGGFSRAFRQQFGVAPSQFRQGR
jgi:AraC-like DNA-binding protein